jgi:glycosyltransferase involved in cell wall biosynthesis
MRRILLIAYHFPPLFGSSGIQRTLRFAQYLPSYGWEPHVLTVTRNALFASDPSTLADIPSDCHVVRVPCLDAQRHLSLFGYYPPWVAVPDRWSSWAILGPAVASRVCRERQIDAIWSTYPIATAHLIGAATARRTGLPWIADFRDPMIDDDFPSSPSQRRSFIRIEAEAVKNADRLVFVTRSASRKYQEKYPHAPASRFVTIENGYDESVFASLSLADSQTRSARPVLLHSGIVYPHERDPAALFDAIAQLRDRGLIRPGDFVVRFRAAVHDDLLQQLARTRNVSEWIEIASPLPYRAALEEMLSVDALLLMQGRVCNEQIPAKLYEYLRAGRPIIGLADPDGDTGAKLLDLGVRHVAPLEDAEAVAATLLAALDGLRNNAVPVVPPDVVARYSRRELAHALANTLNDVVAHRSHRHGGVSPSSVAAR